MKPAPRRGGQGTRKLGNADVALNDDGPVMEVDSQSYVMRADEMLLI